MKTGKESFRFRGFEGQFTEKDWGFYYPESGIWSAAGLEEVERKLQYSLMPKANKTFITEKEIEPDMEY